MEIALVTSSPALHAPLGILHGEPKVLADAIIAALNRSLRRFLWFYSALGVL